MLTRTRSDRSHSSIPFIKPAEIVLQLTKSVFHECTSDAVRCSACNRSADFEIDIYREAKAERRGWNLISRTEETEMLRLDVYFSMREKIVNCG